MSARPTSARDTRVCVARIGAAHGLKGEVRLWSFTQDPGAIGEYGALETKDGKRRLEIEALRAGKDHFIAKLSGVDDRDAAEALNNAELFIAREKLPAVAEDEFYHADLIGLDVVDPHGAQIGTVHALHNFGAGDIIEIMPVGAGQPVMFPFNETTVPVIDLEAKQIVLVPPAEVEAREIPPLKGEGRSPPQSEGERGGARSKRKQTPSRSRNARSTSPFQGED
jgi:16S rRNA processing protein RimM